MGHKTLPPSRDVEKDFLSLLKMPFLLNPPSTMINMFCTVDTLCDKQRTSSRLKTAVGAAWNHLQLRVEKLNLRGRSLIRVQISSPISLAHPLASKQNYD